MQVGSELGSLPTCTRHGHRHRVTATRGFPPDDEHDVLETCFPGVTSLLVVVLQPNSGL